MRERKSEEKVYQFLKEQIQLDLISPNTKLTEWALAKELEVSRSPVRAALKRLEGEGYVVLKENIGAFAQRPPLSAQDYVERLEIFELLWIQYLFQIEAKGLVWPSSATRASLQRLEAAINQQLSADETLRLVLECLKQSLALGKNSYYKSIILQSATSLIDIDHLHLRYRQRDVLQLFVAHFGSMFAHLEQGEFAAARREMRIFINDLNLSAIDRQDLRHLEKYQ